MRHKIMKSFLLIVFIFSQITNACAFDTSSTNYKADWVTILGAVGSSASSNNQLYLSAIGESIVSVATIAGTKYDIGAGELNLIFEEKGERLQLISNLQAKTSATGIAIEPAVWEIDDDPYFYWHVDITPEDSIAGYSVSLDTYPDAVIDTTEASYQFPENSILSGKHTVFVLPFMPGITLVPEDDNLLKYELWVDIIAPQVTDLVPTAGIITTNNTIPISCTLYDEHSGVDSSATVLNINENPVTFSYDAETQTLKYQPDTALPEGQNAVLLKAIDRVGNYTNKGWNFIVDTQPPTGNILLNNGESVTHSAYVTVNINADDSVSGVQYIYLSNDGVFDNELQHPYSYAPLISGWLVAEPDVDGIKTVYAKFQDYAGNISEPFKAEIALKRLTPETRIISGPGSITEDKIADFTFESTKEGSVFSYKLDNGDWSQWSSAPTAHFTELAEGNHYFYVKGAYDLNGNAKIEVDEEDSTPAEWIWTIKPVGYLDKLQHRILFWRR